MLVDCTKALALTNLKIEPIYSELFLGWNSIFGWSNKELVARGSNKEAVALLSTNDCG